VDTVVLDKTGTVTTGEMALVDVATTDSVSEYDALRLVGSLEEASEHPIAAAIAAGARERGVTLTGVEGFAGPRGLGVTGVVDGHGVVAGRESFLAERSIDVPADLTAVKSAAEAAGRTAIVAGWDGRAAAVFVDD